AALPVLRGWGTWTGGDAPEAIVSMARAALAAGEKRVAAIAVDGARYDVSFVPVLDGNYVNVYFNATTAAAPRS
ncbi:MAG TPA: hypothetical protein VHL99_11600, partial [Candidatus Binatia bacterium]|nr:hypothetical protein [Candidatus Binatia bacterium]